MFALHDQAEDPAYKVSAIHNEQGYKRIRSALARQYDVGAADPNIQVAAANLTSDRKLLLEHRMHRGIPLHDQTRNLVCGHIERLWGHEVVLAEIAEEDQATQVE
jgi:stage V sporulation protein R